MNRKEFGQLVKTLRQEHLTMDIRGGYFKPWTREQFAAECQKISGSDIVDFETLVNIENGRRTNLQPEVLIIMADALKLTSGERKEFFLAATGLDAKAIYPQYDDVQKTLDTLLTIMQGLQSPAFITDQYWDILALNKAVMDVYDIQMESLMATSVPPITQFNLMRILFSSEFDKQKDLLGDGWERFALKVALLFRSVSLRYKASKYFQTLYPKLCEFDDFRTYIQRGITPKDNYLMDNIFINLNHARYGLMKTISTSLLAATPYGELQLFTFTPLSPETIKIFTQICEQGGNTVFLLLPNWPENRNVFL